MCVICFNYVVKLTQMSLINVPVQFSTQGKGREDKDRKCLLALWVEYITWVNLSATLHVNWQNVLPHSHRCWDDWLPTILFDENWGSTKYSINQL